MKHVVRTLTILLYALACSALTFGLTKLGRAVVHSYAYEQTLAEPVYSSSGIAEYYDGGYCADQYEYRVGGTTYRGQATCKAETGSGFSVLYERGNPAVSVVDDRAVLIKDGLLLVAMGGALGLWASLWRSRSVALNGRRWSVMQLGSGAWGFIALFGFTAAIARDLAEAHAGMCDSRRQGLTRAITTMVTDHERRFPREWLRAIRENFDRDAVLTGSPECLAANDIDVLVALCSSGFHIAVNADVGSPVCDLSGSSHYKADIEFLTDRKFQTVNIRYLESP